MILIVWFVFKHNKAGDTFFTQTTDLEYMNIKDVMQSLAFWIKN